MAMITYMYLSLADQEARMENESNCDQSFFILIVFFSSTLSGAGTEWNMRMRKEE